MRNIILLLLVFCFSCKERAKPVAKENKKNIKMLYIDCGMNSVYPQDSTSYKACILACKKYNDSVDFAAITADLIARDTVIFFGHEYGSYQGMNPSRIREAIAKHVGAVQPLPLDFCACTTNVPTEGDSVTDIITFDRSLKIKQ